YGGAAERPRRHAGGDSGLRVFGSAGYREGRGDRRRRRDLETGGSRRGARSPCVATLELSLDSAIGRGDDARGPRDRQPGSGPASRGGLESERVPVQRLAEGGNRGDGLKRNAIALLFLAALFVASAFDAPAAAKPRKKSRGGRPAAAANFDTKLPVLG